MKTKFPLPSMLNNPPSLVLPLDQLTVSLAEKVCTTAVFSLIEIELVKPVALLGPVMIGLDKSFNWAVLLLCVVAAAFPETSKIEFKTGVTVSTSAPLRVPLISSPRTKVRLLKAEILLGTVVFNVGVPPYNENKKSVVSKAPLPTSVLYTFSLKVMLIVALLAANVLLIM